MRFLLERDSHLIKGTCEEVFDQWKFQKPKLIFTSPPYNLGKDYEVRTHFSDYLKWQSEIIDQLCSMLDSRGSICYQVGNFVDNGEVVPLDVHLYHLFARNGFKLRNRVVWHFGHGLHCKQRFSGRYEVVLWYTKSDDYLFKLDEVRVPSKYPSKRAYKGPNRGKFSGNPLGKNPEDVWHIPNVKGNHVEKTQHPCQFPVELVKRFVLALTDEEDLVLDPFMGVGSTGVACAMHNRKFVGVEKEFEYFQEAHDRIRKAYRGGLEVRDGKPVYDSSQSKLSAIPDEFLRINYGAYTSARNP